MKKIIIFMSTMVYFLPSYGMEPDRDPSPPKKSPQLLRKNSQEIIIPPAREGSRAGRNVPPLDLQEVIVHTTVDPVEVKAGGSSKQRVKSLKDLGRCVSQKPAITSRAAAGHASSSGTHTRTATRGARLDVVIVDGASNVGAGVKIPVTTNAHPFDLSTGALAKEEVLAKEGLQKVPSLLPKILAQQSARPDLFDDKKSYSEEEVWGVVQKVSPALYAFALQHLLSIEEVEEYALLIEELDIDPSVMNEYVHQNSTGNTQTSLFIQGLNYLWGDPKKQNMERLAKEYEKIKKDNPETYKQMILEVMKAASDIEAGGKDARSAILDTHVGLQNNALENNAASIRQGYVAAILGFIGTMGTGAWAVYGQAKGSSSCIGANCTG